MSAKSFGTAALATACFVTALSAVSCLPTAGISTAEAKTYTRKKVNGRWITGVFHDGPSKAAVRRGRGRVQLSARGNRRAVEVAALASIASVARPAEPGARPDAEPASKPASAARPGPVARDGAAVVTAALVNPATPDVIKEGMRPALEARARTLASTTAPALPGPLPILLPPKTVTFDFQQGTKTVVYGDDIVVTEPFDRSQSGVVASLPVRR